jgi:hypothetical protein
MKEMFWHLKEERTTLETAFKPEKLMQRFEISIVYPQYSPNAWENRTRA